MKILELNHFDSKKNLIYQEKNIKNIIHTKGEELILKILFAGESVPSQYYIGLDSRSSLSRDSDISAIYGLEPTQNYYSRQKVDSNGFAISTVSSGIRADSPLMAFKAVGGSWGPVNNIFLSTNLGTDVNNNILISSVKLSRVITVSDGETITMKMGMALSSC